MYQHIVTMQDENAWGIIARIERAKGVVLYGATDSSVARAMSYLSQWDSDMLDPSDTTDVVETPGRTQIVERDVNGQSYVLTWDWHVNIVSLYRKITASHTM